jgi:signal transduction histidine kinase
LSQREQVAVTSRVFCVAAILGLALVVRDGSLIQSVLVVAVVGAMSAYVSYSIGRTTLVTLTAETLFVGVVIGATFRDSTSGSVVVMPYLVVLPLLAGLFRGLSGVLVVMVAQLAALLIFPLVTLGLEAFSGQAIALAPWMLTNLGGGLLGMWARSLGLTSRVDQVDGHYESARQLLTQLRSVTRRLSAGLDSDGMAAQLMETLHERLDDSYAAVFVKMRGSVLVPLGYRGLGAQQMLVPNDPLVERCWADMEPVIGVVPSGNREARHRVVLPLRVGNRMIGVAVSSSGTAIPDGVLGPLMREVEAHSLRLDTALVFDEIRTMATADERQRLAREIHDGIAQEVASLGYVVDHMAATTHDPDVAEGLRDLRAELSRVVADLRLSIFDLRSDVSAANGLGAALSDYVRQVGAKSDLTVHLTLNEAPTRLAPAVEAEMLRIAQEAITNARKHASAHNLWVDCWTSPPQASLTVRDDGQGILGRRDDSYGISIMRERASRIDATLDITSDSGDAATRGTVVRVKVAAQEAVTPESA